MPDEIVLSPDELAIINAYREQLADYRRVPSHFILKFDVSPDLVRCTIEKKLHPSECKILSQAMKARRSSSLPL
jgi:hypothetical protein